MPPDLDPSRPAPLVLVLHGGGSTSGQTVLLTGGGWNRLADREGFIVAYPDGAGNRWNDSRQRGPGESRADDVGFLSALIDHLSSRYNIDPNRVFSTGISNGAAMSHRLACELSDKIAAIGPVVGHLPEDLAPTCAPVRPVSVVAVGGTEDPIVPWEGGEVTIGPLRFGRVLSGPGTARFWASRNGCSTTPSVTGEPDRDPGDSTTILRETYSGCRGGAEVVQYVVQGGGHTWPGGLQYLPPFLVGHTSHDIDATEVIWEFFETHGRS